MAAMIADGGKELATHQVLRIATGNSGQISGGDAASPPSLLQPRASRFRFSR